MCAFLHTPQPNANSSPVGGCFTWSGHSSPSSRLAFGPKMPIHLCFHSSKKPSSFLGISYRIGSFYLQDTWVARSWANWWLSGSRRDRGCKNGWYRNKRRRRQNSSTGTCIPKSQCGVSDTFALEPRQNMPHRPILWDRSVLLLLHHNEPHHRSTPKKILKLPQKQSDLNVCDLM